MGRAFYEINPVRWDELYFNRYSSAAQQAASETAALAAMPLFPT
jgi:hypothetical protein